MKMISVGIILLFACTGLFMWFLFYDSNFMLVLYLSFILFGPIVAYCFLEYGSIKEKLESKLIYSLALILIFISISNGYARYYKNGNFGVFANMPSITLSLTIPVIFIIILIRYYYYFKGTVNKLKVLEKFNITYTIIYEVMLVIFWISVWMQPTF